MITLRQAVMALTGTLIVFAILVGIVAHGHAHVISVTTDTLPVTLELNDSTYTIRKHSQSIRVPSGSYTYRASANVDGQRISLVNKLDLVYSNTASINLNYSKYTKRVLSQLVCGCSLSSSAMDVTFLEDYNWVVVDIKSGPIDGKAVLQNDNNGGWAMVEGISETFEADYYPQSVQEVLSRDQ